MLDACLCVCVCVCVCAHASACRSGSMHEYKCVRLRGKVCGFVCVYEHPHRCQGRHDCVHKCDIPSVFMSRVRLGETGRLMGS